MRKGPADARATITYTALNESSLARRLEALNSLGLDVLLLSEVRSSVAQQASIACRAFALGYHCVWSRPPPASNTFETPPGGVAILAKQCYALRKLDVQEVASWERVGRAVAALLMIGQYSFCPCVCMLMPRQIWSMGRMRRCLLSLEAG